jgi:hypothetical protein
MTDEHIKDETIQTKEADVNNTDPQNQIEEMKASDTSDVSDVPTVETQTYTLEDFVESGAGSQDFFAGLGQGDALDAEIVDYPAFDFAVAPVIKLKDGTEFHFKIPDLDSERRADNLRKTLIITSPAKVNGFNPTQETTDYATADVRYFLDNLVSFKGLKLNRTDADDMLSVLQDAKKVVRNERGRDNKVRAITAAMLVPVKHARAAAGRIFGGKIEVEKPDTDADRIIVLNEVRFVTVKQEFGVEQNDDGSFSLPTNVVRYIFREPSTRDLSFWQTKCFLGYKIPIKGGGSREERFFNTDKTVELFDMLIERIEGGALTGVPVDVRNTEHLKNIPVGVKRTAVTLAMGEVSGDVGNS